MQAFNGRGISWALKDEKGVHHRDKPSDGDKVKGNHGPRQQKGRGGW